MAYTTFRYRAFLSYSHADTSIAIRVHRRLEGFHIDKELVGRVTSMGPIPKTLRPIFRDRSDFDAGTSLADQTIAALDESVALILLASPRSAQSKYVSEEVRLFRTRHPDKMVIPLIIDGEPDGGERECFPPALRFALAPNGGITETPVDLLAADLREKGDGFELALAKVAARLVGLAPDDVYRRSERERRRQNRLRLGAGAMMVALAILGGALFWQSHQQRHTLDEITALVEKYGPITSAQAAIPGPQGNLTEAITAIVEGAGTDPRYSKALELLKLGKPAEAEPLLKAVADDKAARADRNAKEAAAAYRDLASIAALSEPARARDYYVKAAQLDPSNIEGMLNSGWYQESAGQLDGAQTAFARVIAMAKPGSDDNLAFWAQIGAGDVQEKRGAFDEALFLFQGAQALADRAVKSDPGNVDLERDLGRSHSFIGDVRMTQNNLAAAVSAYQSSLAVAQRLAKSDAGKSVLQLDLVEAYKKVGWAQTNQGNLPAALDSFQASLSIIEGLVKSSPGDIRQQHNLATSHDHVGDVQLAQGNLAAALRSHEAGLAIMQRLGKSDPNNADWQVALALLYNKVGNERINQGNLTEALGSYQASLAIMERLVKSDPNNAVWQAALLLSYAMVGDARSRQGDLTAALGSYKSSLSIAERLARSDPNNVAFQLALAGLFEKVGDAQTSDDPAAALSSYQSSRLIAERLSQSDPSNAVWQRNLAGLYQKISDAENDSAAALKASQASLAIMERLAKSDSSNTGWQEDLAISYEKFGNAQADNDKPAALSSYHSSLIILERLAESDPDDTHLQRNLSVSYSKIGDVQKDQGNLTAAISSYQAALAIMKRLADSNSGNLGWQHDLSVAYNALGDARRSQGDLDGALGRYRDSLSINQMLVAKDGGNTRWMRRVDRDVHALDGVAYDFVLARVFDKALEVADQTVALKPDWTFLQKNRAHALMFLDRTIEARPLYLRCQGESNWCFLLSDDFAQFRRVGLTNPLMDEIEKLLAQK